MGTTRVARKPHPPVMIDSLVERPEHIRDLVRANAPYWPVQRYINNAAEYAALSGSREPSGEMFVAPVFRGNWALRGEPLAEPAGEIAQLLQHPTFADSARRVFGGGIVVPHTVYVNLTWQLPFAQGRGHTDIPTFRGFDRTEHDVAFLTIMGLSGLFEPERVKVATAVAWFYRGADGGFEYWPEGADHAPVVHEGAIDNSAVVGDNDFMWHRVRPTGDASDGLLGLSLDAELDTVGTSGWEIRRGEESLAAFDAQDLRISLSWKANVFTSEEDRARHDDHSDDLTLATVRERLAEDLALRGVAVDVPDDPEHDPGFISLLAEQYVTYPA